MERVPVRHPLIFGHRGASRVATENTIAAFRAAGEVGADGVELDVRRTSDGMLVVHHDPDVPGFGVIVARSFASLRAVTPAIPTLEEALDATSDMIVNVEIKCLPWEPDAEPADRPVVRAVIDRVRDANANVILSSFDLGAVDACRALAPEFETAWLTSRQDVGAAAAIAHGHGHQWLNPDRESALRASAAEIASAPVRINVWTVDDPNEIRQLARAGVAGIISNVPDVAISSVERS